MKKSRRTGVRLTLTVVALFAVVLVFTGRLVDLQVVQSAALSKLAVENRSKTVITPGVRGSIVDTNGVVLADSVNRFDITVSPKTILVDLKDPATLSKELGRIARLTGTKTDDLLAAIEANPKSDFAYLAKSQTLAVSNAVQKLKVPGVYPVPVSARVYPNGALAGNLLGFVGTDGPQAGLEMAYNKCLSGTNGSSTYEKSEDGTRIPGSTLTQKDAKNGGTLELTIDSDLQYEVQDAIEAQAKVLGAPWATGVVERVSDGHLLAVADYPSVDPNDVNATAAANRGSRAFTAPYEPGSTFKGMSAASMIDAGTITPTTHVVVPPVYTKGLPKGAYIKDSFYHGTLHYTTAGVLENSSNIGISVLSESLIAPKRYDYMVKFGVGSKTAAPFPNQSPGLLHPVSQWDPITNRAVEFGQGVEATSVQMAEIYETLANHGVREPSTLVEGCKEPDGTVTDQQTVKPVRVVSAKAADETVGMLETVVTGGPIGSLLRIPGYRIAAKTGTAQVAKANGGGYGNDYIISVAGVATAENPQYVVVVTFGPTTLNTSAGAAPAFKNVMTDVLKRYRVAPSTVPAPYVQTTW